MELITDDGNLSHQSVTDMLCWYSMTETETETGHILKCIKEDGCEGLRCALELIVEHADLIELCQIPHFTY